MFVGFIFLKAVLLCKRSLCNYEEDGFKYSPFFCITRQINILTGLNSMVVRVKKIFHPMSPVLFLQNLYIAIF